MPAGWAPRAMATPEAAMALARLWRPGRRRAAARHRPPSCPGTLDRATPASSPSPPGAARPVVNGTGVPGASATLAASSISLQTGTPRCRAPWMSGWASGRPGATTSRARPSRRAGPAGPRWVLTPKAASSPVSRSGASSQATTSAPASARCLAAARPERPRPATSTGSPANHPGGQRAGQVSGAPWLATGAPGGQELGVEQPQPEGDGQAGQDPEADDHGELRPLRQLEVVVDGGDLEHPPLEQAERRHLNDDRKGLDHVQPAEHG